MGEIAGLVRSPKLARWQRRDQPEEFRSGYPSAAIRDGPPMKIQPVILSVAAIPIGEWASDWASGFARRTNGYWSRFLVRTDP
jgi:hypothetical protein